MGLLERIKKHTGYNRAVISLRNSPAVVLTPANRNDIYAKAEAIIKAGDDLPEDLQKLVDACIATDFPEIKLS